MHEKVSALLAAIGAPGRFAVRRSSPPDDLQLEVKGVGSVPLPVSRTRARALCAVARPARYGLKERTLFDRQVRDTWEIPISRVRIDKRRWNRTLLPQLEQIAADLGLPEGTGLKAQLHSMLVYEPGQFFAVHQDSEKADDMIGSLVVVLPSTAKGGAIVVEHNGEQVTYRGSDTRLTFIAFYADCRHEVRPVRQGYRVALTYDLSLSGDADRAAPQVEAGQVDALTEAMGDYFRIPRPPTRRDAEGTPPERLVYLLDHEYTRRSLGWSRLKGADAARVAALQQVAARLDCGILLGLADVHETWQCEEEDDDWGYGRSRRYREDDDDDEDDDEEAGDGDTPALIDLVDYEIQLRHCLGSDPGRAQIARGIDQDEVCWTTDADDLEPYAYEHEGYMGNYGNTVDRWYHRAAVVLWPREHSFALRARSSAHWAMGEVAKRLKAGDVEAARRMAQGLLPLWSHGAKAEEHAGFPARALGVAAGLDDPDLAAALMKPFTLERLTPDAAPGLVAIAGRYGLPWCAALLEAWDEGRSYGSRDHRLTWLACLPGLCRPLCGDGSGQGPALAQQLVAVQCAWTRQEWKDLCELPHPRLRLEGLEAMGEPILGLLESCLIARRTDLHDEVLAFLTAAATGSPLLGLVQLVRTAHRSRSRESLGELRIAGVHRHCAQALRRRLDEPARAEDDWSIAVQLGCTCDRCTTLSRFLAAADRVCLEWPLAKAGRAHVHQTIDERDLPVDHTTRRAGSPYVLVLTKTNTLFQREAAERSVWRTQLGWLEEVAGDFDGRADPQE